MNRSLTIIALILLATVAGGCGVPELPDPAQVAHIDENDKDGDGSAVADDCNDTDSSIHPGAEERCDGKDNDCDGQIDEDEQTIYPDADGDGYGEDALAVTDCSVPDGYVSEGGDCDDGDPNRNPGEAEVCGDGVDNDCNPANDSDGSSWYLDADQDGFGAGTAVVSCTDPSGAGDVYVLTDDDCNDLSASVYPGAAEVVGDGVDQDCDGLEACYEDLDGDGFGSAVQIIVDDLYCGSIGQSTITGDCDDNAFAVSPAEAEVCNGIDDDCAGGADNGLIFRDYFPDGDSDLFGDEGAAAVNACQQPAGHVLDNTDCDDGDSDRNPGEAEVCGDGVDNDCNPANDATGSNWYLDGDQDGYGSGGATVSCLDPSSGPDHYVVNALDCDDVDPLVNPAAAEVAADGTDQDCDGEELCYVDGDLDSYGSSGLIASGDLTCLASGLSTVSTDCNDGNSAVNPGEAEVCNGIDDDCFGGVDDGLAFLDYYPDADDDGFGNDGVAPTNACAAPTDHVANNADCDDTDDLINPNADEVCDGDDNDCDGTTDVGASDADTWYHDGDLDTFGDPTDSVVACSAPGGYIANSQDCDDTDGSINPSAVETCDGVDEDCVGGIDNGLPVNTYYEDSDSDTYGNLSSSTTACIQPAGYVSNSTDCNDNASTVHPGAAEIVADGVDQDCDTFDDCYQDSDFDTYGSAVVIGGTTLACSASGESVLNTDCNDAEADAFPRAHELGIGEDAKCLDGIDNDCNGGIDAADWDCQNDDGDFARVDVNGDGNNANDPIYNAVDAYYKLDDNLDGDFETFCVVADLVMSDPWSTEDVYYHGSPTGSWGGFDPSIDASQTDLLGAIDGGAWCHDFTPEPNSNYIYRYVSQTGADGVSPVDLADCNDWVKMNVTSFCTTYNDEFCRTFSTDDTCNFIGRVAGVSWDGTNVTGI